MCGIVFSEHSVKKSSFYDEDKMNNERWQHFEDSTSYKYVEDKRRYSELLMICTLICSYQ